MKLSYEDKVQIYELRKQEQSFKQLSKRFQKDFKKIWSGCFWSKVHGAINQPLWNRNR